MNLGLSKDTWKRVAFGDVIRHITDRVDPETSGLTRYLAGEHIPSGSLDVTDWGTIGDGYLGPAFYKRFLPGHVLYVSRRTYLRKVAVPEFEGICGEKTFVLETVDPSRVTQRFIPHLMSSERFHRYAVSRSRGSVNPYLNWTELSQYEFDLPPLDEQNRIADLFWTLELHRRSLRRVLTQVERCRAELVDRTLAECLAVGAVPLASVAEIRGGIQKGKPVVGPTISRPYLRVANVQAGRIDLEDVKTLEVSPADATRFALRKGDVLMTEGGDIDKLGRGTVWQGEVDGCLHQNHVFAVRVDRDRVLPEWVSLHMGSTSGRRYFRAAAKRTSNLATINKAQVSAFVVAAPPLAEQEAHLGRVSLLEEGLKCVQTEASRLEGLRQSLSGRIFGSEA